MSLIPRASRGQTCIALLATVCVALSTGPVPTPAFAHPTRTLAPCAYEDGPGPCVWDAKHRGNGVGDSFVVRRDGRVVYVTHRRAHRLSR